MTAATAPARSAAWLHGPTTDLVFGCGLWYFAAFALLAVGGESIRQAGGATWIPLAVLVFSTPHYGATLLRVYEQREDRRAYRLFAVHTTLLLLLAFAAGVHIPIVGSALLTLYMTWSPWHYAGQNYGLAVMFLRRRGIAFDARTKRALYLTFFLSFLLTFLMSHGRGSFVNYTPLAYAEGGYHFLPLGLPQPYTGWLLSAVFVAYAGAVLYAVAGLWRSAASLRAIAPSLLLMASQSLWFAVPTLARHFGFAQNVGPLGLQAESWYFLWIAIAHSLQYLWVTSAFAEGRGNWGGLRPYLGKTMLAGACVWVLPVLAFSPDALGRLSFDAGLGLLVASIVNLHHFILDGAIWKLRDGRVAKLLMRDPGDSREGEGAGRSWLRPAVWATGAACTAILFYGHWASEIRLPRLIALEEREASGALLEQLRFLGRDSAAGRDGFAQVSLRGGRPDEAIAAYARSAELHPKAETYFKIGKLQFERRRFPESIAALEACLALRPNAHDAHFLLGRVHMTAGDTESARRAFERAAELAPERKIYQRMIEQVGASG